MRSSIVGLLTVSLFMACMLVNTSVGEKEEVYFTTVRAPSGKLRLGGTVYLPSSSSKRSSNQKYGAVVLIHGSGTSDRYETISNYPFLNLDIVPPKEPLCGVSVVNSKPFDEIGEYLSKYANMIVLTYDKRGCCTSSLFPICNTFLFNGTIGQTSNVYHACSVGDVPQLYDYNTVTMEDYVLDAFDALEYLLNRSDVNPLQLNILGHSEGTMHAVKLQSMWNSKSNYPIANVFLFNGLLGFAWDRFLIEQFNKNVERARTFVKVCEQNDPNGFLDAAKQSLATNIVVNATLSNFLKEFRTGIYPENRVYKFGMLYSGYYLWDSFNISSPEFVKENLLSTPSFVCSLNSPTDLNIAPSQYEPLQNYLSSMKRSSVRTHPSITHFGGPANLNSSNIRPEIFDYIHWCLCGRDGQCQYAQESQDYTNSSSKISFGFFIIVLILLGLW